MAKFVLSITAIVGKEKMTIYRKHFDHNIMAQDITCKAKPVLYHLRALMPFASWEGDDGCDLANTTYCQYYCNEKGYDGFDHYLLATWREINEETK